MPTRNLTLRPVRELRRRLDNDGPAPVGLVGETRDPFSDHQVLAYDCERSDSDQPVVHVYDMNCPGRGQTLELDLRGPALVAKESCPGARGRLRGMFCETYAQASPP